LAGYNVARHEIGLPSTKQEVEFELFQSWIEEKFKIKLNLS
jgi:hypothetical protein